MDTVDIEVWVMVDEDGDYVVEVDSSQLKDRYEQDIGELNGEKATRLVKLTVKMPKPKAVELTAEIGDETPAVTVKVA